jgi:oxygen-dependent protoporphyrinogen oxidase
MLKGLLLNAGLEPLRPRWKPSGGTDSVADESVDSFFRRRFGPRIADNLASAMVHGIYAADSRRLSVRSAFPSLWDAERSHGSVLLGSMFGKGKSEAEKRDWEALDRIGKKEEAESWSIYGLQGGTATLTDELQRTFLQVRPGHGRREVMTGNKVDRLTVGTSSIQVCPMFAVGASTVLLIYKVSVGENTVETDHIISAIPASAISRLVPPTSASLSTTQYTTVGVINLVFPLPPSAVHPAGFGYLVPRCSPAQNPQGILGVIFDSTALPGNDSASLDGQVTKLTVMMGGPWWSSYVDDPAIPQDAEELAAHALQHVQSVLPVLQSVEPLVMLPRLQKDCIPTYVPGHGANLGRLHRILEQDQQWAGKISLVGNGYGGVGVNDCVLSAEEVVQGLADGTRPTGLEGWASWE